MITPSKEDRQESPSGAVTFLCPSHNTSLPTTNVSRKTCISDLEHLWENTCLKDELLLEQCLLFFPFSSFFPQRCESWNWKESRKVIYSRKVLLLGTLGIWWGGEMGFLFTTFTDSSFFQCFFTFIKAEISTFKFPCGGIDLGNDKNEARGYSRKWTFET